LVSFAEPEKLAEDRPLLADEVEQDALVFLLHIPQANLE
jgi:hypothetical protein